MKKEESAKGKGRRRAGKGERKKPQPQVSERRVRRKFMVVCVQAGVCGANGVCVCMHVCRQCCSAAMATGEVCLSSSFSELATVHI